LIQLPESLKVQRNKSSERMLLDKARDYVTQDERTPGIHASDLLDERQAFWKHVDPQPLTDRLTVTFLVGRVLHAFVLGAVDDRRSDDIGYTGDASLVSSQLGLSYSPDKVMDGIVREVKTSRSFYEPKDVKDLDIYIEQLLIYMAATQTTTSQLWVLYLNLRNEEGRTAPDFRSFDISISDGDLAEITESLRQKRENLEAAIAAQDWRRLDLCRSWKCGRSNCDWYDKCKPEGRYGTEEFDKLSNKRVPKVKKM
jgi:hypothetical protein